MLVGELMSKVVYTAKETDTVRDVHSSMRASRIRHMPVLDDDKVLIGVVSVRDLYLGWSRGPDTRIKEVMTRNLQWVRPTAPAHEAAARLLHDKIGCLPVLDERRQLVGIITDTDFLEIARRALAEANK